MLPHGHLMVERTTDSLRGNARNADVFHNGHRDTLLGERHCDADTHDGDRSSGTTDDPAGVAAGLVFLIERWLSWCLVVHLLSPRRRWCLQDGMSVPTSGP